MRFYDNVRQTTHFEQTPDQTEISWIEFPDPKRLKQLTPQNFVWNVKNSVAYYPQCAIGEESIIVEFDIHNWNHPHYAALRCHLIQDFYLDSIVRGRMIDSSRRFKNAFGFIKLVGLFFNKTGMLMNRNWLETHVLESLLRVYPEELALNTYKHMDISNNMDNRINAKRFDLSKEELSSIAITDQPERIYGELYSRVLRATRIEM